MREAQIYIKNIRTEKITLSRGGEGCNFSAGGVYISPTPWEGGCVCVKITLRGSLL